MQAFECLKPFCTIGEAVATEAALEEAGIPCRVHEEFGGVWGSLGSARVLVAREDLERAAEVLTAGERTAEAVVYRGDSDGEENDYWNAPEAFAPFGDDDGKRPNEMQPWELAVLGPVWFLRGFVCFLYFAAVFAVSAAIGYFLALDFVRF